MILDIDDPIFNTSQTLEIGPNSRIVGAIRFGGNGSNPNPDAPDDRTQDTPTTDVLKFVFLRDADGNRINEDAFTRNMELLIIDDFNIAGVANLPDGTILRVNDTNITADTGGSNPALPDALAMNDPAVAAFIAAGFVGQNAAGDAPLAGDLAGSNLNVRRLQVFVPHVILEGAVDDDRMVDLENPNVYGPQIFVAPSGQLYPGGGCDH